ncbi:MAG: DUF488 domain-containing protein [bacterium]|nr:DUF488 domain-containing protein [bacterium]
MSKQPPPKDVYWPQDAIFTIGHSTLPIERFIDLLHIYGIERLVDIRTIPGSRHNPQFNGDALINSLAVEDIEYAYIKALGGLRRTHKESPNMGWRNKSFRGYADYMQTEEFQGGLQRLMLLSRDKRVVIMCAEAVPWRCHRSLVADALCVRDMPVIEILSATGYRYHKMTAFAQVDGVGIVYPPEQTTLL